MTRAVFLLPKDPIADHGGDVVMSDLVMRLARASCSVAAIALSRERAPGGPGLTRVPKPPVRPLRLLGRRSLVHERFDVAALRAAIERTEAEVWVAEHSYMAESLLRSTRREDPLVVDTHNPESVAWRLTRGLLGRVEAPRLARDELRVARAAAAVGTYDAAEADSYRARGVASARWLDLTLEPGTRLDVGAAPPRLLFLGTRAWSPNQEAFERAVRLWPAVAAGVPGAELCVAGAPGPRRVALPDGVRDLGFVADLDGLLGQCRGLLAPVRTGGGVRVKLLDAARVGLPVVGTTAAVGSLGRSLGLAAYDDEDAFVEECRRLLTDPAAAAREGARLHEVNAERWRRQVPHAAVERLVLRRPG